MSKSTNDFVELKKWFNLDGYNSLASFNQNEWANQIAKRFFIDDALKNSKKTFLDEIMPKLISVPLDSFDSADYRNGSHRRQPGVYSTKTVLPLTLSDISILHDFSKENTETCSALFDEWNIRRGGTNEDGSFNENGSAGLGSFAHLRIDLNARNETIQSDFRRWLTNYRKAIALPEVKSHPADIALKFKDWREYKLLQYFDINAWCQWSNKRVTKEQKLELLFHGADLSKLITTHQKLNEIINYQNVMALLCES